jgi:hypothetical protein
MNYKYGHLLSASYYIGIILLIGGWAIFILWMAGRYLYAIDLQILVLIGSQWLFFGFFVALIGLLFIIIYSVLNIRNLHWEIALNLLLLISIPSAHFITKWYFEVEDIVFVRFTNKSELKNLKVSFLLKTIPHENSVS